MLFKLQIRLFNYEELRVEELNKTFTRVSETSTYLQWLRFFQKAHSHLFHSRDVQTPQGEPRLFWPAMFLNCPTPTSASPDGGRRNNHSLFLTPEPDLQRWRVRHTKQSVIGSLHTSLSPRNQGISTQLNWKILHSIIRMSRVRGWGSFSFPVPSSGAGQQETLWEADWVCVSPF